METIVFFGGVLAIGAVMGWVSFFQVSSLRREVQALRRELQQSNPTNASTQATARPTPGQTPTDDVPLDVAAPTQGAEAKIDSAAALETNDAAEISAAADIKATATTTPPPAPAKQARKRPRFITELVDNWMIWLGGISVALAGIFMVKYSISSGLLGPSGQIALAIATGLILHGAAELLRRRNGGSDPVFAALAGGASITLYAALLAALHLYQLFEPGTVFIALAVVSLATMLLSLAHGPVLAIIGMIGAYVVPILVNTHSGNLVAALIYSLIISGSALLLIRYVFRPWLWWSVVAGALGWWLISFSGSQAELFRSHYLALLAWGLIAIPRFDWLLNGANKEAHKPPTLGYTTFSLSLVIAAWAISIFVLGSEAFSVMLWAPLIAVLGLASAHYSTFRLLPWLSLMLQCAAILLGALHFNVQREQFELQVLALELQPVFLSYAAWMTALYAAFAAWQWRRGFNHPAASLALLAPLVFLALAYLLVNGLAQSFYWSLPCLVAGAVYALLATHRLERNPTDRVALWMSLAAHFAYSLAVTLYFREAGLSLAIAAQLLSLALLIKRYQLPWLDILLKVVVALVVTRLTFNPWLASYPNDVHWTLWTYGGATVFAALATWQSRDNLVLRRWLEAATLHLLVMTLGTELRYQLYDGEVFAHRYSLTEAAVNCALWGAMALSYQHRARVSENLSSFYRACSRILLALSFLSYGVSLTIYNPWWSGDHLSATPIFNILLLAYGAPVVLALLVARYHEPALRRFSLALAGLGGLLFVALEIRQLWHGGGRITLGQSTSDGELYTYSVVYMVLAIAGILLGTLWRRAALNKAGMALLGVVIAKIFLLDMAGLEGLWRVAAFMGLGLSLLGLAWIYRRTQPKLHDGGQT